MKEVDNSNKQFDPNVGKLVDLRRYTVVFIKHCFLCSSESPKVKIIVLLQDPLLISGLNSSRISHFCCNSCYQSLNLKMKTVDCEICGEVHLFALE